MSDQENERQKCQSVLFITYDGLLDPLGGSQILPYIYDIASHPRQVHIISFEKMARFRVGKHAMREELAKQGIRWTPLSFTSRGGKLGKAWDLLRMYGTALKLQLQHRFGIAHCRSYQAMQVGCFLRRLTGVKTIFDMRGLWVDDRVDRAIWPQKKRFYRVLFRYYKWVERQLLGCADAVVVLTERVIPELHILTPNLHAPITVIPCCADFDHFQGIAEHQRAAIRATLNIGPDSPVLSYLGSLGSVYLFDDMLNLFEAVLRQRDDVHLLLITKDWSQVYEDKLVKRGLDTQRSRIHVRPASRDEVPGLLGASDTMLNFIAPTYSMKACSPTKMAESLAMGIPVISNSGVGDVDCITQELDAGAVIDLEDPTAFDKVVSELDDILAKSGSELRERAREKLGLEVAKERYRQVYAKLEQLS